MFNKRQTVFWKGRTTKRVFLFAEGRLFELYFWQLWFTVFLWRKWIKRMITKTYLHLVRRPIKQNYTRDGGLSVWQTDKIRRIIRPKWTASLFHIKTYSAFWLGLSDRKSVRVYSVKTVKWIRIFNKIYKMSDPLWFSIRYMTFYLKASIPSQVFRQILLLAGL